MGNNSINFVDPSGLLACTYQITTHSLSCKNNAGQTFNTTTSASGNGSCQNNKACVDTPDKGPISPGYYSIKPPGWSTKRPKWLYLEPSNDNEMYDRGGFFIHPWGLSKGCIMLHIANFNTISGWAVDDQGGTLNVIE